MLAGASLAVGSLPVAASGAADVPPPLTPVRLLTAWAFEPLPVVFLVVIAAVYLYGLHRLHARGDRWPVSRTLLFLVGGIGTIAVATLSSLATYDETLLSVHMMQHMLLSMVAPIFLALGAPITLALRTLPLPWRRRLLALLHSRVAKVLTYPAVAGAIFVANPFALYFTGFYDATLRHPLLHDFNHLHFLVVGCLWFWPLLGLDPMPMRLSYPMRMIATFVTMPFHAFLGITVMGSTHLIGGDWYRALGRTWGPSLASDQVLAGGILWASGDLLGVIVFVALFVQWMRASDREARRVDRQLDRLEAEAQARTTAPGVVSR